MDFKIGDIVQCVSATTRLGIAEGDLLIVTKIIEMAPNWIFLCLKRRELYVTGLSIYFKSIELDEFEELILKGML